MSDFARRHAGFNFRARIVLLLVASAVSGALTACICPEPTLKESYRSARSVIFAIADAPVQRDGRRARVPLRSVQWLKGKRDIDWIDTTGDEECGFNTVEGLEYLLFLDENQVAQGCAGSRQVKSEDRDALVGELRRLK